MGTIEQLGVVQSIVQVRAEQLLDEFSYSDLISKYNAYTLPPMRKLSEDTATKLIDVMDQDLDLTASHMLTVGQRAMEHAKHDFFNDDKKYSLTLQRNRRPLGFTELEHTTARLGKNATHLALRFLNLRSA